VSTRARSRIGIGFWSFVLFMLALTGLFAWLGAWQLERLADKEALIAEVDRQLSQPPYDLPPADQWSLIDLDTYAYHPLTLTGRYRDDKPVLVFTSLSDAKGKFSGPGYWVMAPFESAEGGIVFVNRGFIPQSSAASFAAAGNPAGDLTLTGIALEPEAAGPFTPGPDRANRIEWLRDPIRLAAMAEVPAPIFGLFVDAPAGEPGALPQGGETVIEFPNNHLGYAFTWFGFALLTPALLAFWIWRQIRPAGPV
jgi:surfeit locus 1 family protein